MGKWNMERFNKWVDKLNGNKFHALALRQSEEGNLKPRNHVRILIYRTWAIDQYNLLTFTIVLSRGYQHARLIGRQQNLERTGSDQPL